MPYTFLHDPETKITTIKYSGNVSLTELKEVYAECARQTKEEGIVLFLSDTRDSHVKLTTMEIYSLPEEVHLAYEQVGLHIYNIRRAALILKNDLTDAGFFETVAINRGQQTKYFHEMEQAKNWLLKA